MTNEADHRQLVLVGGGHAHVQVLKAFAADPPPRCDITVIAKEAVAMYSGMAPGFVAGQYARQELEIDVRPLAALCNARTIIAPVTSVDPEQRVINIDGHDPVRFDVASFNLGSTVLGLDLPGVREHTLPTRPLSRLVDGIADLIDRAKSHVGGRPFHVVVVGGGVGGVELAFTTQWRLHRESGKRVDVTLLDGSDRILSNQSGALRRRVLKQFTTRGIAVRSRVRVQAVEPDGVTLEGDERIESDVVIWVTGPASHGVFRNSPTVGTDDGGFAFTRSTLQLKDHDRCFAVGDCATMIEHPDTPRAGVYAVRQGPVVTHNLRAFLAGEPLRRYTPQSDFLMLLNTGDGSAIGTKWGFALSGRWVMRWKDRIDKAFMVQYQVENAEDR